MGQRLTKRDIRLLQEERKINAINYINNVTEEKNELESRIDKAIEYIENNWIEYSDFQYVDNDDELNIDCESIKELLNILKGSDKE